MINHIFDILIIPIEYRSYISYIFSIDARIFPIDPGPGPGDRSGAICVERAVRFALVVAGMDAPSASWWSGVGLRAAAISENWGDHIP